jgi:hypothetical protein
MTGMTSIDRDMIPRVYRVQATMPDGEVVYWHTITAYIEDLKVAREIVLDHFGSLGTTVTVEIWAA